MEITSIEESNLIVIKEVGTKMVSTKTSLKVA